MGEIKRGQHATEITIHDIDYDLVQGRINGGAVYVAHDQSAYLRLGEPQETAEEHVHLVALRNRGYPVGEVIDAGSYNGSYFYVEKSLGDQNFGQIFGNEYKQTGAISDKTFGNYKEILDLYLDAAFRPTERKHATIDVRSISLSAHTFAQFGINEDLGDTLLDKAQSRLSALPRIEMHPDLGPFNTMPRGIIDFEMVEIGPIGYDVLAGMTTGYYFPKTKGYHTKLLYEFSEKQFTEIISMVDAKAIKADIPKPTDYLNDMYFLRTIWAAARPVGHEFTPFDNPAQERFWSEFRANILNYVIECYKNDTVINPQIFPEIGLG